MRRFATVGAALLSLVAGAADAADLPGKIYSKAPPLAPIYDWSGFYIGLNAGAASSHKCWTIFSNAGLAIAPAAEGCHDATGGLAGGQLGYRWQFTSWVFGLEAQGDWAGLKGSNANQAVAIPATNETRIDAIGLFTGHIGYAWNNVLWYVKGGAAVTNDRYSTFFTATNVTYNEARESRWGGVVGTGVEFGFAPNWSVALEYDHLFMGTKDVTFPVSALAVTRSDHIRQDVDMGTVRVNYRFGGLFAKH
jgi:outer membrane immunogenic protein